MFNSLKRRVALATAAGTLALAGSAIASSPALAFHLTYNSASGAAIPTNTAYTANTSNIAFTNSSGGVLAHCTGTSTLNGVTVNSSGTTGGTATGLNVTGGSFNTCSIIAAGVSTPITVTGSYSTPWVVEPTGGSGNSFTGTVTNVKVVLTCPNSKTSTYTGTLSTGGTENNASPHSNITLSNAQSLSTTITGSSCALPATVGVTGVYTLATVGGSASNNIWENAG